MARDRCQSCRVFPFLFLDTINSGRASRNERWLEAVFRTLVICAKARKKRKKKRKEKYPNWSLTSQNFHLHPAGLGFGWGSDLRWLALNSPPNECRAGQGLVLLHFNTASTRHPNQEVDSRLHHGNTQEKFKRPGNLLLLLFTPFECFSLIYYNALTLD